MLLSNKLSLYIVLEIKINFNMQQLHSVVLDRHIVCSRYLSYVVFFSCLTVPTTAVLGKYVDGKGLSEELLILMICAGIGGLILISIVLACVFTRFYRWE